MMLVLNVCMIVKGGIFAAVWCFDPFNWIYFGVSPDGSTRGLSISVTPNYSAHGEYVTIG